MVAQWSQLNLINQENDNFKKDQWTDTQMQEGVKLKGNEGWGWKLPISQFWSREKEEVKWLKGKVRSSSPIKE